MNLLGRLKGTKTKPDDDEKMIKSTKRIIREGGTRSQLGAEHLDGEVKEFGHKVRIIGHRVESTSRTLDMHARHSFQPLSVSLASFLFPLAALRLSQVLSWLGAPQHPGHILVARSVFLEATALQK